VDSPRYCKGPREFLLFETPKERVPMKERQKSQRPDGRTQRRSDDQRKQRPQGHGRGGPSGHQNPNRQHNVRRQQLPRWQKTFLEQYVPPARATFPEFRRLALHVQPHADEILALVMLEDFGGEIFPNLDTRNIEWVDRNVLPHERSFRQRPACLHVGCGGDPRFDEHVCDNPEWEAACTLVGGALGLLTHPFLINTTEHVRREDRHGKAMNGEIAFMVKLLYLSHGGTPEGDAEVIRWAKTAYRAEIQSMKALWETFRSNHKDRKNRREAFVRKLSSMQPLTTKTAGDLLREQGSSDLVWFKRLARETLEAQTERRRQAEDTFLENARCYTVERPHGGKLRLFVVQSDNPEMASVAWRKFNGDIVAIRSEAGHTAIMTRTELRLNMSAAHAELQRIETADGADWVLVGEGTKVLNGSSRFTGVTPSGLSLDSVAAAIRRTLGIDNGLANVGLAFAAFEQQV